MTYDTKDLHDAARRIGIPEMLKRKTGWTRSTPEPISDETRERIALQVEHLPDEEAQAEYERCLNELAERIDALWR